MTSHGFHVRRSNVAHTGTLTQHNGIRSVWWESPAEGNSVRELQTTHTPTAMQKPSNKLNYLTPPLHWHWYQEEFFHVTEGRYIFTLEGKDMVVSASDLMPIKITPRARHTFKADETHEGPCSIEISTAISPRSPAGDPEGEGMNEKFFRNIYQYLDDCWVQGQAPRLPQLLLILHSAEVSLALPGPAWLALPISYAMGVVIGLWWGGYVLGYRASYPEYYDGSRESKKER
ncbi:hypothetical protein LTR91_025169 [Friedmanniomyces endolithicus]|uniref:Cupin type-2 domain-containing protein n=1 Tax=Friedmanniomyces endolithicus TaxID=329885 RepID=A0A4U0U2K0_9PEZI|nr:hypothetical protein LTR03_009135 [Friedmanniomyces endolithicus]KAK0867919.1 hypothetical protein LTS02_003892 [Friedmanniomyces endolithicus]KAK0951154.1 hypothetical protein LTR91_025169 [Friedmanniomyces endolithicus]KAK0978301.1 hypothetical protein LTS01_012808 [Friedmanniomyces endolithicus]TKA28315.1 hypothetical protein B0A54_16114 [Friedmanniomyces endolithicus]